MALSLTPVTWTPVDSTGAPLAVSVTFTAAADSTASGTFVSAERVTVRPGNDGTVRLSLVPGPYTVAITAGQQISQCAVTVPVSVTAVDLDTLLPTPLP